MRHFLIFIILIFSTLSFFYFNKEEKKILSDDSIVRVYASASFIAKWGPAPKLKEIFEKQGPYKVEFIESPDVGMTLQKINFENQNSITDVVLGLDQFDVARSATKIKWKKLPKDFLNSISSQLIKENEAVKDQSQFVPYDWAPMSFVARQDAHIAVLQLNDLLKPELKAKIALQDPRTSSPGLQFLAWIYETKSETEANDFLKLMMKQAHSFSSGWSAAYGLFKNKQVDTVFSYVTSPLYHQVEESDHSFLAIDMKEALPVQVEFAGIPETCKNCEGAEKFVEFLLSQEAQKILMTKNYMLPIVDSVKESTLFESLKVFKTLPIQFHDQDKIEKWINQWAEIRKNEGL
jgi:thiamine transport system substrate-binding protein